MISARGLGRRFGDKRVLRDLDLADVNTGADLDAQLADSGADRGVAHDGLDEDGRQEHRADEQAGDAVLDEVGLDPAAVYNVRLFAKW